jgi:hypothetical protein
LSTPPESLPLVDYDWAVLRAVPRVHLGASVNVGVVLHARTVGFLALRALTDPQVLASRVPGVDPHLLARYLEASVALARGEPTERCGPSSVALAPTSERFHWLTAPRSDVLQASPVHGGLTRDPQMTLERLFLEQVGGDPEPSGGTAPLHQPSPISPISPIPSSDPKEFP